jgi:hypothetical protein
MSWHHRSSGLEAGLNNVNAMPCLGFDTRITPFPAFITHFRSRNPDVHASYVAFSPVNSSYLMFLL